MTIPEYLHYWGKAGGARGDEPAWHPLPYHCVDVASVADALLLANPRKLNRLANLLGPPPDNARRLIVSLVALHDIGKVLLDFQAKSPEAWEQATRHVLGEYRTPHPSRHDADGYALGQELDLQHYLQPALNAWHASDFDDLWSAVTGHHGQPANVGGRSIAGLLGGPTRRAAEAFVVGAID